MKNKVNKSIEIPSTGKLVREGYELVQLMDCNLYVLPSNTDLNHEFVKKRFDDILYSKNLINQYDVEILKELPRMDNHPKLSKALKGGGYNLMIGMNEPGAVSGKQYLLMKSSENSLTSDLTTLLRVSEQITSESVKELMFRHAMSSPNNFIKDTQHIWDSDDFWRHYFVHHLREFNGAAVAMGAPISILVDHIPSLRGKSSNREILTHKKKLELQYKFIENILALKENENNLNARKEVKIVLDSLNIKNQDMIAYLTSKPQEDIVEYYEYLSPVKIAERSNITMEIKGYFRIDKIHKNDGHYRLYLRKENQEELVHFERKPSFILYLIYLMDIVKSESVDTLRIEDLESDFLDLYAYVYGGGGREDYNNLLGKGNATQKMYHQCLKDIRNAIGNACEILHERYVSPFILQDSKSHLYIKKEKITISEKLLAAPQNR